MGMRKIVVGTIACCWITLLADFWPAFAVQTSEVFCAGMSNSRTARDIRQNGDSGKSDGVMSVFADNYRRVRQYCKESATVDLKNADRNSYGTFLGVVLAAVSILCSALTTICMFIYKINPFKLLFGLMMTLCGIFSFGYRMRRFRAGLKADEVTCRDYVSVGRSCRQAVLGMCRDGRLHPGVYFFYGPREVGKKSLLVGELGRLGARVVRIPEREWLVEGTHVNGRELLNAFDALFSGVPCRQQLLLVLDGGRKSGNECQDILKHVVDDLYVKLSDDLRGRIIVVVKFVGMYAANDVRTIRPIMVDALSADECVEFAKKAFEGVALSEDLVLDKHDLYVNSMGHPGRLLKYLRGDLDPGDVDPDIQILEEWDDRLGEKVDRETQKLFYCCVYLLSVSQGSVDLDTMISLVTKESRGGSRHDLLRHAFRSIMGSRRFSPEAFDADLLFQGLEAGRMHITAKAGYYREDSKYFFADVLTGAIARYFNGVLDMDHDLRAFSEEYVSKVLENTSVGWEDAGRTAVRLIRVLAQVGVAEWKAHGLSILGAVYRTEWLPRCDVAEDEELAAQVNGFLKDVQEMRWPGYLESLIQLMPLICKVTPNPAAWSIASKSMDDYCSVLEKDGALDATVRSQLLGELLAVYCYCLIGLSVRKRAFKRSSRDVAERIKVFRRLRNRIWPNLTSGDRRFVQTLRCMLSLAHFTECDAAGARARWLARRRGAIREFLAQAEVCGRPALSGVILSACSQSKYNLFLDGDERDVFDELLAFWKRSECGWDELRKEFVWTLQWYKACSDPTELANPADVMTIVDRVISELDVSGNKCISGNPATAVDMMWLASTKFNAITGLSECAEEVNRLFTRLMSELKRWTAVLNHRNRLRLMNYFVRMIDGGSLADEDLCWMADQLVADKCWIESIHDLDQKDDLRTKVLRIATKILDVMKGRGAFDEGGEFFGRSAALRSIEQGLISAVAETREGTISLVEEAVTSSLINGNLPLALACVGIGGVEEMRHLPGAVCKLSEVEGLSCGVIAGLLEGVLNAVRGHFGTAYDGHAHCSENTAMTEIDKASALRSMIDAAQLCRQVGGLILLGMQIPGASYLDVARQDVCRALPGRFALGEFAPPVELAVLDMMIGPSVVLNVDLPFFRLMATSALERALVDSNLFLSGVQLLVSLCQNPVSIGDAPALARAISNIKQKARLLLQDDVPVALAERKEKMKLREGILNIPGFVFMMECADLPVLKDAKSKCESALSNSEVQAVSAVVDLTEKSSAVRQRVIKIEEAAEERQWMGSSAGSRLSVKMTGRTIDAIEAGDGDWDMQAFADAAKEAVNDAIRKRKDWVSAQAALMKSELGLSADVELDILD